MPKLVTIPEKKAAPKGKPKDPSTGVPNWADNKKTVEKVLELVKFHFAMQKAQGQRTQLETNMEDADQMTRMSVSQDKQDVDQTDGSDNIPHVFMAMNRMITAYETDIAFPSKEPPGKFVPMETGDEFIQQEAAALCDQRNNLLEYSMEVDNRKAAMKDGWHFDNKYGNGFYTMEWKDVIRSTRRRMVSERDAETGEPTKIGWKTEKVDESHPHLVRWNLRNVWMDSNIDCVQDQICVNLIDYPTLAAIVQEGGSDHYLNVGMVSKEHQYAGEPHSQVRSDRQDAAGESPDVDKPTGNFNRHTAIIRLPLDDNGKWDEKGSYPTWHWVTFVGDIEASDPVCVRINPNPFNDKDVWPMYMQHTHPDDKGAYHRGYVDMVRPVYNEYKTVLNQWFELKNQKCASPWLVENGVIMNSNKDFHSRRQWNIVKGGIDRIKRLPIDINTNDMVEFIRYLEQKVRDIYAVQKSFEGVAMGGRTSAQEAKNAMDQSTKPAMSKLRYMSGLIEWMAETDSKLWEQFAKTSQVVTITRGKLIHEIKPAELWGRFKYKVTSVDEFETNTLQRQEFDRWFQVYGAVAMETMPTEGKISFLKDGLKGRAGFDSEKYWPPSMDADARKNAKEENMDMLRWDEMGAEGEWREPQEGENFDLHIDSHKNDLNIYRMTQGMNPENAKLVQAHIELTEQMKKESQAAIQAGAQQAEQSLGQQAEAAPALGDGSAQTDAQAGGDLLAAGEGQAAL